LVVNKMLWPERERSGLDSERIVLYGC